MANTDQLICTPATINRLVLKNRLVMPLIATYTSDLGFVSQAMLDYYTERTNTGLLGLLINKHSYICPQGIVKKNQLSIADEKCVPSLSKLTEAIHRCNCKVFLPT